MDPSIRVMVVDDEPAVGLALSGILKAHGYSVCTAVSVAEACRLFSEWCPDCMVLDMMLSDGSGLDVLAACGAGQGVSPVPVILVSALGTSDPEVQRGMELGAFACLGKPFDPGELIHRIMGVLA